MGKSDAYDRLVSDRLACRRCNGLTNPSVVSNGCFDSGEIGPWSRWQGNLDARLMVVGQDWGDVRYFTNHGGLEGPQNPTNDALQELIGLLDIQVGSPGDSRRNGVVFLTNAVLCLKDGGLQSAVGREWFTNCGFFLRRQVEIVGPRLLICLGERAYHSVAASFGFRPGAFRDAVDNNDGVILANGTRAFPRYHCGRRIQNSHRSFEAQRQDWKRLIPFL